MVAVTFIDNYDSFTWNLVHYLGELGADVSVHRNDALSVQAILEAAPQAIMISPGPGSPAQAGICIELIKAAAPRVPIFGVCLGHQAIGEAFGGTIARAPKPMHGKVSAIAHDGSGVFYGINGPFEATRYHSLVVDEDALPPALRVSARADDLVMGIAHKSLPVHGVQFHPESIATEHGHRMVKNFLDLAQAWNQNHR